MMPSPMPVWLSENEIDPEWVQMHTKLPCVAVQVEDISNQGRRAEQVRNGATLRLKIQLESNSDNDSSTNLHSNQKPSFRNIIIKQVPPRGETLSQRLGLAREALFYSQLGPDLDASNNGDDETMNTLPKIYYAWGDMTTGQKVVLMEDLSCGSSSLPSYVDSGIFFGPGNPNNWTRDLKTIIARSYSCPGDDKALSPPSSHQVAKVTFTAVARVHAVFWRQTSLLDHHWLRGSQWLQGQGKDSWMASQKLIQKIWKTHGGYEESSSSSSSATSRIQWDSVVYKATDKAVRGISWEAHMERLNVNKHWTLVHGDFWPGNVMWLVPSSKNNDNTRMTSQSSIIPKRKTEDSIIKLLDWEMVGLGSGPQDLGQYILSNMEPSERRSCEKQLIQSYHQELIRLGVRDVSWEYCWDEYRIGGLERWLWFLVYFAGQDNMLDWAQFFHDQISAFMKDHDLTFENIVQPRP